MESEGEGGRWQKSGDRGREGAKEKESKVEKVMRKEEEGRRKEEEEEGVRRRRKEEEGMARRGLRCKASEEREREKTHTFTHTLEHMQVLITSHPIRLLIPVVCLCLSVGLSVRKRVALWVFVVQLSVCPISTTRRERTMKLQRLLCLPFFDGQPGRCVRSFVCPSVRLCIRICLSCLSVFLSMQKKPLPTGYRSLRA